MEYNSENVVKLSQADKKVQVLFLFFVWFRSAEFNSVSKSAAIKSLIKFMTTEMNWEKKKAAQQILNFFQEHQGWTDDQLIDLWNFIKGEE